MDTGQRDASLKLGKGSTHHAIKIEGDSNSNQHNQGEQEQDDA
jgi:hypothetical protein